METIDRVSAFVETHEGEQAAKIAQALMSRKEATDTELAEELGQKPSHIRKVLYSLYEHRIAEYHKEKDKETGWLTFLWHIDPEAASAAILTQTRKEMAELQKALEFEETHEFFSCPTGDERFDFAQATEHDFHCPEHGAILNQHDNAPELHDLRARIQSLQLDGSQA